MIPKKYIPGFLKSYYHFLLVVLAATIYGFPSQKIKVIGITGTQGKSTTVNLLGKILEEAGFKTSWVSSLNIKIGQKQRINPYHMTMPGRFFIQKFLRQSVNQGCDYAIIEVTSEGIIQHRHRFINFDVALFTNLSPEHIERHGSFKKYKQAKEKLFQSLSKSSKKVIDGRKIKKIIIANLDDEHVKDFLQFPADEKWGYRLKPKTQNQQLESENQFKSLKITEAQQYQVQTKGIKFNVEHTEFNLKLLSKFNIYNALAAICAASSQGIGFNTSKNALQKTRGMAGRMEEIIRGQKFKVFVDLAHTPNSFKQVFKFARTLKPKNIIAVFGSAGGGRDKWKRPELGKIAANFCQFIVLTNEDPYDENPGEIINNIEKGVADSGFEMKNCFQVEDRRKGIKKALSLAKKDDIVMVLGKGTEQTMVVGEKTSKWDDRETTKEELEKVINQ